MNSQLAIITLLGGGAHPDQGLPGSGAHPDQGLPGSGAHPDQGLPSGGAHPWFPGHLPPTGSTLPLPPPIGPDNTLPDTPDAPPPQIALPIVLPPGNKPIDPAQKFELKYSVRLGWVLVPVKGAQPK
jgi:hypothetical protein